MASTVPSTRDPVKSNSISRSAIYDRARFDLIQLGYRLQLSIVKSVDQRLRRLRLSCRRQTPGEEVRKTQFVATADPRGVAVTVARDSGGHPQTVFVAPQDIRGRPRDRDNGCRRRPGSSRSPLVRHRVRDHRPQSTQDIRSRTVSTTRHSNSAGLWRTISASAASSAPPAMSCWAHKSAHARSMLSSIARSAAAGAPPRARTADRLMVGSPTNWRLSTWSELLCVTLGEPG